MTLESSARTRNHSRFGLLALALFIAFAIAVLPALAMSSYPPMMEGKNGYSVDAAFTIGESVGSYLPVGIPDGTAAFDNGETVRILVNHELNENSGYAYQLANGTMLTGARVSFFDFDKSTRELVDAGLAYGVVYDRRGNLVTNAAQINESGSGTDGFARFCSAQGVAANSYGFVDNIFFTNEETSASSGHPHGGSVWALDVDSGALWAIPAMGRGAWENVTPIDSGSPDHVALLLGDDEEGAPLYLYIGRKNALGDGSFLDRNGLVEGQVYAWKARNGDRTPEDFNGTGSVREGSFIPVQIQNSAKSGRAGYDAQGYLDDTTLRSQTLGKGAFSFSRPEDLHTNPANGSQVVMTSTGRGQLYPSDNWGTVYIIDMDVTINQGKGKGHQAKATISILHDADDYGDSGVRSADNLVWSDNGMIYVQEDRSTSPSSLFGAVTGREASIWKINPTNGDFVQVSEMDRSAVAPVGSTDSAPSDIGNWESSGIIDVTALFDTEPGETLLFATVQAHSIRNGIIATENLVQGGQLIFISK